MESELSESDMPDKRENSCKMEAGTKRGRVDVVAVGLKV